MILSNKIFSDIQGHIPKDLHERLVNRRNTVVGEDKAIRERVIRNLCEIVIEEHFEKIMRNIEPLPRNKTREILIMGGNYEEEK